ncbi:hypothetical protein [Halorarius halobius]|uniref:hypothetical protein n=1 Tax=Halorarius halobius TaxID=2962671 RepID=UPI0020CF3835|nr:hypothetical protein [Halorarius halobius]
MSTVLAVLAIVGALLAGWYAYRRLGQGPADATYDAVGFLSATFWILAGVFAIVGGFVIIGIVILLIASYIWLAKGAATKKRLRKRVAE